MKIVLKLPVQLRFGSNEIKCFGETGTDSDVVNCVTDVTARTITITNAVTF